MYEENNDNFIFKNIILKLLVIVVVIFIIIWLFPTKGYLDNQIDKKIGISEDQVFNNNISVMKEGALGYYVGSRLPQTTDKKEKLTLQEMLDKNLLTQIKDSKGNNCDTKKSYVEVTKDKDDYKLKVNLTCKNKEEYVISYFGAYDYCTSDVCEKKKLTEDITSENNKEENNQDTVSTGECQYSKSNGGYWTNYGNWSSWTTSKVNSSNSRQVQTKTEKIQTGTQTVKSGTTVQKQTPKKLTYSNGAVIYECSSEFDNYGRYTSPRYCIKTVPQYETKPVYKQVTYYKYRDRKYINKGINYIWDTCNNSELLSQGYVETGKTR